MPEGPDNALRWQNLNLGQLISYLIPILGAAICFALAFYLDDRTHFGHELARDLGIAFVVALVVTVIYEVYARRRYEREKFISALQLIMDEVVHPRVWEAVRKQVIERNVIRENNQITLSLEEMAGLESSQMVLRIDYNYELRSLRSRSIPFEIYHFLDDHIQSANNNLPKFERVEIGSTNFSGNKLKEKIESGVFSTTLALQPRYKGSLPVRTRRKEITYVPGSYNLFMNELCAGVRINLDRIPAGIIAYVRGPHAANPVPLTVGPTLNDFSERILLPGQGFEFRFAPEVAAAVSLPLFAAQQKPAPSYHLRILSPALGASVLDGGWIRGTANLPADSHLWVFVGALATPTHWRPQGHGVVHVKADQGWEVHASYGNPGDTGSFNIVAVVVDDKTNARLQMTYARAQMEGGSIPLPQAIGGNLLEKITVKKTQFDQLKSRNDAGLLERRTRLERRGQVLAVKNDRRNNPERRSRKAG